MAATLPKPALWTRPFVLVALANMMVNLATSFSIHLPGFLRELGAREAQIGSVMSVHALAAMAAGPLIGRMMDRSGRCRMIRAGAALFVLASALYLRIDALGPFVYCVRIIDGLAATMLYASLFTYAADVVPETRRTEGLGLFGASGLLPLGVSGQLGDVILASMSYRTLFAVALAFAVGGLLASLPLRDVATPLTLAHASERRSVWAPLLQRELRSVWVAALAFFFSMSALLAFLKTFVLTTGHGSVGQFYMVYASIALVLRGFLGWLPDRIGLRRMVLPALGFYALGTLTLAYSHGAGAVLLAGLFCGIGHSYGYPVFFSLVVTRARPSERGAAMTTYTCIDWAGFLTSGPLVGLAIERLGYVSAFGGLAGLLICAIAGFYLLDRG